jgi:3-oxoacyl-[acyl-carrier protein] reductase
MLLKDRVAIITGAAHGQGRGIALKFADEGCNICAADILEEEAKQTAEKCVQKGREAIAVNCDHTDAKQVKNMVDQTIKKFGKIDILVNTAGVSAPLKSIADYTEEEWDKIYAIHVKGPFLCCKYVVPYMKEKRSGNIINFSTTSAIHAPSGRHHYASAKAAIIGLTLNLAVELGVENIRVNVIVPGLIRTEFYDAELPPDIDKDAHFENIGKHILLGRYGIPEDIAGVALFLASDLSAYVTGQQMLVGGGAPLRRPMGPPPPPK